MKGVNSITIFGNMGRDCTLRGNDTKVGNFSLAVGGRAKVNGQWTDTTDWFDVVVFGKTAEAVAQYTSKGSQIIVEGSVHLKSWKKNDGTEQVSMEVRANEVTFVGGKSEAKAKPARNDDPPEFDPNDDVPF